MDPLTAMNQALKNPVSLEFKTNGHAWDFRNACYQKRAALRIIGIFDYNILRFKLVRNVLVIKAKEITI